VDVPMSQGEFYVLLFGAISGLAVVVAPILKLNSNITKLNSNMEYLNRNVVESEKRINDIAQQQNMTDKVLYEHKYILKNHEDRIDKLEK
jgi:hypothetical protein